MIEFVLKNRMACALAIIAVSLVINAAIPSRPVAKVTETFPSGFPPAMQSELIADTEADPDPDGNSAIMSLVEAAAVSASPASYTALDVCRARRSALLTNLSNWTRMTDGQRGDLARTASNDDAAVSCAARFADARACRVAQGQQEIANLRRALVASEAPESAPVARRIGSAADCQWFRDEIERDDHEAARATTRDLREAWEHNRLGAENSYRDICR